MSTPFLMRRLPRIPFTSKRSSGKLSRPCERGRMLVVIVVSFLLLLSLDSWLAQTSWASSLNVFASADTLGGADSHNDTSSSARIGTSATSSFSSTLSSNLPGSAGADAEARADFGSLGVSSSMSGLENFAYANSTASASSSDSVTITNGPQFGFLQLQLHLEGNLELDTSGFYTTNTYLGVGVGVVNSTLSYGNALYGNGSNQLANDDLILTGELPFSFGQALINIFLNVSGQCWQETSDTSLFGPCSGSANYFHTLTVTGVQVLDINREIIPDAALVSESGFDYQHGFEAPVPEPSSLLLLGSGFSGLGFVLWRRRSASDEAIVS